MSNLKGKLLALAQRGGDRPLDLHLRLRIDERESFSTYLPTRVAEDGTVTWSIELRELFPSGERGREVSFEAYVFEALADGAEGGRSLVQVLEVPTPQELKDLAKKAFDEWSPRRKDE